MRRIISHHVSEFFSLFKLLLLILAFSIYAMPQTCSAEGPGNFFYFARHTTVYYDFSSSFSTYFSNEISHVEDAITLWNSHNQYNVHNCSGITFVPASGAHPATLTFVPQIPSNPSLVAEYVPASWSGGFATSATIKFNFGLVVSGLVIFDPTLPNYALFVKKMALHELGHSMGLKDSINAGSACTQNTTGVAVMNGACGPNDNGSGGNPGKVASSPTTCDNFRIEGIHPCPCEENCDPTDPDEGLPNPPTQWTEIVPVDYCTFQPPWGSGGCPPGLYRLHQNSKCCWNGTPVIIDVDGDGIELTDAENGVSFDINNDGIADDISWTETGVDDAWLSLDANGNGTIDSGHELFGNFTPQSTPPWGEARNGFLALAEFDKIFSGGNGDGLISRKDSIYDNLRLWQDLNHNGVSEPNELATVNQLGLRKIHLDYAESRRVDQHGNQFVYRTKIKDVQDAQLGRWAWDVVILGK